MSHTLGTKGQLVIEKEIRDRLGLEPGFQAVQRLVGDHVEIRFFPPEHDRSLRGMLAGERKVSEKAWPDARDRAWRAAARDVEKGSETAEPGSAWNADGSGEDPEADAESSGEHSDEHPEDPSADD